MFAVFQEPAKVPAIRTSTRVRCHGLRSPTSDGAAVGSVRKLLRLAIAVLPVAGLCGCSVLPAGSPTARQFEGAAVAERDPGFLLIDLDLSVARTISSDRRPGLSSLGADVYRPTLVLKPGDVIATTVYEVTPIPLFGGSAALQGDSSKGLPVGGHTATLPSQVVEQDGTVPVPFGGIVKVAGLTPTQAGRVIAKSLEGKATQSTGGGQPRKLDHQHGHRQWRRRQAGTRVAHRAGRARPRCHRAGRRIEGPDLRHRGADGSRRSTWPESICNNWSAIPRKTFA